MRTTLLLILSLALLTMGCSTKVAYRSWVTENGWHVKYYYFNGCEETSIPVKAGKPIKVSVVVNKGELRFLFKIDNQAVNRTFSQSEAIIIHAKKDGVATIEICGKDTSGGIDVQW